MDLNILKSEHSDLVEAVINEYKEKEELQRVKDNVPALEAKIEEDKKVIEGKDKEIEEANKKIEDLQKENDEMKKKVDEITVSEALAQKNALIEKLIKESELPDEAVTDVFKSQLRGVKEQKLEDDKVVTVEEGIKTLIEDRKALVKKDSGKVRGSGDEFKLEIKESKGKDKVATKAKVDKFLDTLK